MGGPSSPDVAAPTAAEVQPSVPPPGSTETGGPSQANTVAREAMVGRVESVLGGPPADASPSETADALTAAADIPPESVSSSTEAAAATAPEASQSASPTAEEQTRQQVVVLAKALAEEMQAAKAKETAAANKPYLETVIDLSSNEVADENALALAIKSGDIGLQTQLTEHLAKIRDQRRMLMLKDNNRSLENKISEAKTYRKQAQISRNEAHKGGNTKAIEDTQERYDGANRYVQVLEEENKRSWKKLMLQLLAALGLTTFSEVGKNAQAGADTGKRQ